MTDTNLKYVGMEKTIREVLRLKEKDTSDRNITRCKKAYNKALSQNYHAVAFDIDGTLCDKEKIISSIDLLESIYKLVKRKVILMFVTGRGRESTRHFIYDLRKSILDKYRDIDIQDFNARWYAITHNGLYLLYTRFDNYDSFLRAEKSLYNIELSTKDINIIYYELNRNNTLPFYKHIKYISKEPTNTNNIGLRIILKENNKYDIDSIIQDIKGNILNNGRIKRRIKQKYHLIISKYQNNDIIEITPIHKGDAIKSAARYIGISVDNILRIGDRGAENENDHGMLSSTFGFSVGSISKQITGCFPVMNKDNSVSSGINATTFLINNLSIFPTLTLPEPDKAKYYDELSIFEKKAYLHSRNLQNYYSKVISTCFQENLSTDFWVIISDLFDTKSGGVKFRDWEWNAIKRDHPLKKIFNQREKENDSSKPAFKYILKSDSAIIMRGVYSYYYGLAYRSSPNWIKNWYDYFLAWLAAINKNLNISESKHIYKLHSNIDRKFILAICDNIRHFLLTLLNSLLNLETKDNISLLDISKIKKETKDILKLTITNTEYLYKLLFDGLYPFDMNDLRKYINNIEVLLTKNKDKFIDEIIKDKKSHPRVWREVDFFLENLSCIKDFMEKMDLKKDKRICVYGILYGGIELPIIAKIFAEKIGLRIDMCFIKINLPYNKKHGKRQNKIKINDYIDALKPRCKYVNNSEYQLVLDDNILTGVTAQLILEILYKLKKNPDAFVFVRYPSINRIPQMFFKGHGAPDINLFNLYVHGLTSASPYSRIFSENMNGNPYLDVLGVFNKSRDRIEKIIKKNKLFKSKELQK